MKYRHTQIGSTIIIFLVIAIFLVLIPFYGTVAFYPIQLIVVTILIIILILFYSLTVEIINKILIIKFGLGLIRKEIPLSMIQKATAVENNWFAGWGIRRMPGKYWLWNVSGFRAVELTFKDGQRFRIGTDEPEKLIHAIETNKSLYLKGV